MFLSKLGKIIGDFGSYLDPLTKHRLINAPPLSDYVKNLTPDKLIKDRMSKSFLENVKNRYPKRKMLRHTGDSYIIYEAGLRDPTDPFSKKSFDKLVKETEGEEAEESFEVNPQEPPLKQIKPSGANPSYPQAGLWMQKGLS